MENCYLSSLPRDVLRSLAGFSPSQRNYYLRRDALAPPDSLAQKIFPQIETIEAHIRTGDYESSISLGALLDMLRFFRKVILQDSVILMDLDDYKDHPVFQHSLFKSDEFSQFKR